ncbi:hypothetical protein [Phycisphaera mikurensis]|nr:hypothetical protein [Phycisphaera mikurensis]MBB6441438.1 DNA-directed RNA polymerase subunit RPC12/RpoP [Phycisphaera mikurensis]
MAGFIRFACGNCGSTMKVPAAYAGKRVKCPGCQQAAPVPTPRTAGAAASELSALDLSLLDADDGGGGAGAAPRRIRDLLIGCGACGKSVKIPENRCGTVVRCPKCTTPLKVDCPPPPPGSGKTIDFRHLSLDPVDEPSLAGADGSLAGSIAGLTAGATAMGGASGAFGLKLDDTGGGSSAGSASGGSTSGRDQMAELRTLNDLRAEGSISKDEYKKRRAEVMTGGSATASAARAATSRAVGGVRTESLQVKKGFSLPWPVKAAAVLAVVGGVFYGVWILGIAPLLEEPRVVEEADERPAVVAATPAVEDDTPEAVEPEPELAAEPEGPPEILMVTPGVPVQPWAPAGAEPTTRLAAAFEQVEPAGDDPAGPAGQIAQRIAESQQAAAAAQNPAPIPDPSQPTPEPGSTPGPAVPGEAGGVAFWPVMYPEVRSRNPLATRSAKTLRMTDQRGQADIGVIVGPAIPEGVEGEAFRGFQWSLQRELVDGLNREGVYADSIISPGERMQRYGDRWEALVTSVRRRSVAARGKVISIGIGEQGGRAVAYWFAGDSALLNDYEREAVGSAVLQ